MSERIGIEALKPGMVIVQVTQQNGPVRIRKSGLVTSDAMVTGLREMGVQELEIDPEQTVEIQSDDVQSQTQFLLQSNSASSTDSALGDQASTRQDSQLAEQFNRSLFLPTAQEIPDMWQIYARQFGTAAVIILLGFGLGFGVAVGPEMLSDSNSDSQIMAKTSQQNDVDQSMAESDGLGLAEGDKGEAADVSKEQTSADGQNELDTSANAAVNSSVISSVNQASQPNEEVNTPSSAEVVAATAPQEPEMLVLGIQPQQGDAANSGNQDLSQNPDVSQELLEKFQQVMNEMEEQQKGKPFVASKAPDAPEPEDVPRVDQMPQWVLSSLPRLSFNAHMFATEPADRWVKVNGKELGEGDWIDGQLRIQRIDPQHIILDFQGNEFSMKALSDW